MYPSFTSSEYTTPARPPSRSGWGFPSCP
jgi:hypothetical protein